MLNISLKNRNPHSLCQSVVLTLPSGTCRLDNGQYIEKHQLGSLGFEHPLLIESSCALEECTYVYEYDDFDGLMRAARFVYGVLVRVNDPLNCQFTIKPSRLFMTLKAQYMIPFSIDAQKPAKEQISLSQFNALVSHFVGYTFQYQDNFVLDKTMTIHDLPCEINADSLYESDANVAEFCKHKDKFKQFEIRYINQRMGFGVFARDKIQKGAFIGVYFGVKKTKEGSVLRYIFNERNDCLKLDTDARFFGNFSRFVNHAPNAPTDGGIKQKIQTCHSNVIAYNHYIYGNNVVVFSALEDVAAGAQLFVDYGSNYFLDPSALIFWQHNGKMLDARGKRIAKDPLPQRRAFLQAMAHYGVKQSFGFRKPFRVFLFLGGVIFGLQVIQKLA